MKHSCLAWITANFILLPCLVNCQTATVPWIDYQIDRDRFDLNQLKSRLRFESVSPQMIEGAFQKLAAPHPRIVASRSDFDRLRQALAAKDGYVVATVDRLKKKAEAYRQDPLIPYELDAANLRLVAPHQRQDHIVVMSLLYQLTGETFYAEKVKEHLLCRQPESFPWP